MVANHRQHFAHIVCLVQMFAQFDQIAARCDTEVLPHILPVIDFEGRGAFTAER